MKETLKLGIILFIFTAIAGGVLAITNDFTGPIIAEMESGVEAQNYKKSMSISDRKQAIKTACQLASAQDIILIAGKGHETYQEIQGVRHDFDDMEIVKEFLQLLQK